MSQASQWKDIFEEVIKGLIILAVLERLQVTRHGEWLEAHIDFLSLQANLFSHHLYSYGQQISMFLDAQRRLAD